RLRTLLLCTYVCHSQFVEEGHSLVATCLYGRFDQASKSSPLHGASIAAVLPFYMIDSLFDRMLAEHRRLLSRTLSFKEAKETPQRVLHCIENRENVAVSTPAILYLYRPSAWVMGQKRVV